MIERITADIIISLISAAGFGLTSIYVVVARRERPSWKAGVLILLSCAEFTLAHALQGVSSDFAIKVFWYKMCILGFTIAPTAFFCLTLRYSGWGNILTTRVLVMLSVFPALTAGLVLTNEIHGLIWNPASIARIVNITTLFLLPTRASGIGYLSPTRIYSWESAAFFLYVYWYFRVESMDGKPVQ